MKMLLLACLFFIFQSNYSMKPETRIHNIEINFLDEPLENITNFSDDDWMRLIYNSWLEKTEKKIHQMNVR